MRQYEDKSVQADDEEVLSQVAAESATIFESSNFTNAACSCKDDFAWGCALHSVYSGSLLLAHREISLRIADGPPGLALPSRKQSLEACSNGIATARLAEVAARNHMAPLL